ncbi:MAG: D-apiose dehydrogenase, partial [Actinomycetota bacterium]|nr:D-apiose dehydrogenase [Actinomycetota bacterium]
VVNEVLESDVQRVILEKPCSPDLSTARALLDDLDDRVQMVGVNYTRRYDPLHRRLFSILAEEGVSGGTGHYTAGILNTGSHWLDGLHSAGAVVDEVYASARYGGPDPTPDVSLRLRGGGLVHLHAHDVKEILIYETDLFGPTSRVQLINSGTEGRLYRRAPSAMYSGYHELRQPEVTLPLGLTNPLLPVVDDAVSSVQEGRGMRCSLADAVAVHRVIDGVHRSLKEGSWVRLTD